MHTSPVSSLFLRGQIEFFASGDYEPHYVTGPGPSEPPVGCPTWQLPLRRQPSPLHDFVALVRAVGLLRRIGPEVVHSGTPKAGLIGMAAARLIGTPVRIYAVHGLRYETSTGTGRRVLRALERIASWCATDVVADSRSIALALRDDVGVRASKVVVLGPGSSNGVDVDRFTPASDRATSRRELGIDVDRPVLGFVGRLTHDKGIDDLVEVFDRVARTTPATLLLVGRYEDDDPVHPVTRRRIERGAGIVHIPWTAEPERVYAAMDVLVFPSYREGLPNVPLEAQASGLPVVGYAATGTVDAVADLGLLVETGDVDGLVRLVGELLADADHRSEAGRRAREWVVRFDRPAVWLARRSFVDERCAQRSRTLLSRSRN